jgi:hypothetical protein
VTTLRRHLQAGETAIAPLRAHASRRVRDQQFVDRLDFTRHSFAILDAYVAMVAAAATRCDYAEAVRLG